MIADKASSHDPTRAAMRVRADRGRARHHCPRLRVQRAARARHRLEFDKNFDYVAIAAAIGCMAVRVSTVDDFRRAIIDSRSRVGVSVVVAATTPVDRYQDTIASLHSHDVYAVREHPES
ncbi:hypothetical protein [Cryptosporangium minutisporangium]|uniref:hypothetical protein n=1 Tax=Cryptosporangium minutisporangium TaxID=113569 RepID=UPI0031EBD4B1